MILPREPAVRGVDGLRVRVRLEPQGAVRIVRGRLVAAGAAAATAAAATVLGLVRGIDDREATAHQAIDPVDLGAEDELHARLVDDDGHALVLEAVVVLLRGVDGEGLLEAGATASLDAHPQADGEPKRTVAASARATTWPPVARCVPSAPPRPPHAERPGCCSIS